MQNTHLEIKQAHVVNYTQERRLNCAYMNFFTLTLFNFIHILSLLANGS